MKKINLAISGCLGRMGQQLIKSSRSNKNFKLVTLTEYKPINRKIAGIKLDLNTDQAFKKTDVIVDFTIPKCTLTILKIASKVIQFVQFHCHLRFHRCFQSRPNFISFAGHNKPGIIRLASR